MGIRPHLYVIVGIDDATKDDPRHTPVDEDFLEDILNFRELEPEEYWKSEDGFFSDVQMAGYEQFPKRLNDIIYLPQCEYDIHNIVGLITRRGSYDSDFVRVLATLYPEYRQNGWKRIPTRDVNDMFAIQRGGYTDDDLKCNRFVDGIFESMVVISRHEWQRAMHYCSLVGWTIPEEDLRYLLVWDWK